MRSKDKSKRTKDKKTKRGFLSFYFYPFTFQRGFTPPLQDFQNGNQNDRQGGYQHLPTKSASARAGFTLLETVIALTVILAAVVGPVSLITRGLFSFSFSKNKVIAVNLAQEGLEAIRLVRENNIACDSLNGPAAWEWNRDPDGGFMRRLKIGVDMQSFVRMTCGSSFLSSPRLSLSCSSPLLFAVDSFLPNAGTYGYTSGVATTFVRCVEITSPPDRPDADIPASDQMDVVSTVTWDEHGSQRSTVLQERLYNWR